MGTEQETAKRKTDKGTNDGGRIDRIADQTRGLVEDIKEWIDLKVHLVQLELEERFETLANNILATVLVVVLAFITVLFALIAGALALGNWLGDPLWGFLIVTGVLALLTVAVHLGRPRIVKAPWKKKARELPASKETTAAAQIPLVAESALTDGTDGSSVEKDQGTG